MVPEQLKTKRLLLRRMAPSDANDVYTYASDAEATRFMDWPTHQSVADAVAFTEDVSKRWDSGDEYCWAITIGSDNRAVGAIACRIDGHMADIGYGISRELWGNGYATEAALSVLQWLI